MFIFVCDIFTVLLSGVLLDTITIKMITKRLISLIGNIFLLIKQLKFERAII